jgi:hypothetical protein
MVDSKASLTPRNTKSTTDLPFRMSTKRKRRKAIKTNLRTTSTMGRTLRRQAI